MLQEQNPIQKSCKKKALRYSKSLIFPYNSKQYKPFEEPNNNVQNNNNSLLNKDNSPKKKHLLILQKINIKDKKNNFYKEGVKDIFNDENLFFSDKYKDKKVIVGRNQSTIKDKSKYEINFVLKKNLGNFNKKRLFKSTTIKNHLFSKFRKDELGNSLRKKIKSEIIDKNIINAEYENNSNYSVCSINSKYENMRKSYNIYGKRASFFFTGNNYISDGELKIIYKNFLEKEKENKQKEIKEIKINDINNNNDKDTNNNKIQNIKEKIKDINNKLYKKIYKNKIKTNIDKEINARLKLQEKILNKFQITNKQNQKIISKIIKNTSKDSNDILLMNQLDEFRIKMEKIDEEQKLKKKNNSNKTMYWISSLRNYPKNNDEDKTSTHFNYNSNYNNTAILPIIHKSKRNINEPKEDILDNYINNFQYSFGSNSNLYCDIESNISPLYAFILSDTLKSNEKIRNSHIDDCCCSKNSFRNFKKNFSMPSLSKTININNNSQHILKNLNIEGKRLIDYEIEMSKKLEGKKRLVKLNYNDDETDTKYLAKSYLLDNFHFPKNVKNAFELHSNPDM